MRVYQRKNDDFDLVSGEHHAWADLQEGETLRSLERNLKTGYTDSMAKEKRFKTVHEEKSLTEVTRIICDQETGVCYLYQWIGTGGGLTVLLDKDGKPVTMPAQN